MERISDTIRNGRKILDIPARASSASAAYWRATKYSDWSSSPALGTWSALKWGSRSCQGPGTCCSVQALASFPLRGCCFSRHSRHEPFRSGELASPSRSWSGPGSPALATRSFAQTLNCIEAPAGSHVVQMLTAYAASRRASRSACKECDCNSCNPSKQRWRTRKAGCRRRETCVTMPRQPRPTTASRSISRSASVNSMMSPTASTAWKPQTSVERQPLPLPDPWVAVATAPQTEMCGNEARF
mmetsp:Transcript_66840/g.157467  ORF Transcript_66840/g.157467 Transcript_66840/m.157467 type:complete len:243 (+) Transcript_66840:305-1033(+)